MLTGPNALHILETMGILTDVLAQCDDRGRPMPIFKFVRAEDPHDEIYKVCQSHTADTKQ